MYNFLDLTNSVNKRLNEVLLTPSNFDTVTGIQSDVKNYINLAINRINREEFEWPFNLVRAIVDVAAGVNEYSGINEYPDTLSIAYDTAILNFIDGSSQKRKLKVLDYEEFLERYANEAFNPDISGTPEYIIRTRGLTTFMLHPRPDVEYSLNYDHYSFPEELTSWDDVPNIPQFFKWVIVEGAMYYAHTFKGAVEEAGASNTLFQEGIKQMRKIYINRTEYVRSAMIRR